MRKTLKRISYLTVAMMILILNATPLFAAGFYQLYGRGNKLIGGINNKYYWVDRLETSLWYETIYDVSFRAWGNTDTRFFFTQTFDKDNAKIYCDTIYANGARNTAGATLMLNLNKQSINPETQGWDYGHVRLNTYTLAYYGGWEQQSTACHEIGHAIGLDHVYHDRVIMYPRVDLVRVNTPQADDEEGVRRLYPSK